MFLLTVFYQNVYNTLFSKKHISFFSDVLSKVEVLSIRSN